MWADKINGGTAENKDDIDKVRGWMSIHREELFANWKLLGEEGTFFKIEPLH